MSISEFLKCDKFQSLIEELRKRNIEVDSSLDTVLIHILKESIKQRQYVLYGFNCVLQSEEDTVQWLLSLLDNSEDNLRYICARVKFNESIADDDGEFPPGEEPGEDDKSVTVGESRLPEISIVDCIIELDMIVSHPKQLSEYYKRRKIPGAAKFAADIKRLHKSVFNANA